MYVHCNVNLLDITQFYISGVMYRDVPLALFAFITTPPTYPQLLYTNSFACFIFKYILCDILYNISYNNHYKNLY